MPSTNLVSCRQWCQNCGLPATALILGDKKKSQGTRSGAWAGCHDERTLILNGHFDFQSRMHPIPSPLGFHIHTHAEHNIIEIPMCNMPAVKQLPHFQWKYEREPVLLAVFNYRHKHSINFKARATVAVKNAFRYIWYLSAFHYLHASVKSC